MNSRHARRSHVLAGLLLFLAAALLAFLLFTCIKDWKTSQGALPPAASTIAPEVDRLYYLILGLTGAVFFGVEILFLVFIIRYRHREGVPAHYTHGNKTAEVVWTVIPALILTGLALYQKDVWFQAKQGYPKDTLNPNVFRVEVLAQQYEWKFRYPGPDRTFQTPDDVWTSNQLYVPVGRDIVFQLRSNDVIHSLFMPVMRVKQDAVPGMIVPAWFRATTTSDKIPGAIPFLSEMEAARKAAGGEVTPALRERWIKEGKDFKFVEIACAELCGPNHFKMRAYLTVTTQEEVDARLKRDKEQQGDEAPWDPETKTGNWGWPWGKTAW